MFIARRVYSILNKEEIMRLGNSNVNQTTYINPWKFYCAKVSDIKFYSV
jgi:hypothetical protein